MQQSDVSPLVERARAGSQGAFSALYQRFAPVVHSILLRRCRPAVADELTQECFERAFARLHQLKESASFGAWIATMARRMGSAQGSDHEPEHKPDSATNGADTAASLANGATSPEACTEAQQLLRSITELPSAYSEPLLMRLVEGLSGLQIAELTGMTPDSVRVNLHRGMSKLRERLHKESN